MLIFIQLENIYETAKNFYEFLQFHNLMYTDKIRVETSRGLTIHDPILVQDYLREIPEL